MWEEGGKKMEREGKYRPWQEKKWPTRVLGVANGKQVVGNPRRDLGQFPCSSYCTVRK